MKVVLFCGGLGMRLREYSETIPKPMVPIGYRPILWHVMKYYAHYGHKDFILCLGYKADAIKNYFLHYDECSSNDFVLSQGGKDVQLLHTDIHDWTITFVDSGVHSTIGQRLKAVEKYLEGEDIFFANYSDGLTDFPLPDLINHHRAHQRIASFLCVKPGQTLHVVSTLSDDIVSDIQPVHNTGLWINGGFFIFNQEIFKFIWDGEELVEEPFHRLIKEQQLVACKYNGFWACMDTFKDRQMLEDLYSSDQAPWAVWQRKLR